MAVSAKSEIVDHEQLIERLPGRFSADPAWLRERRRQALDQYVALPLPRRARTPLKNRSLGFDQVWDNAQAAPEFPGQHRAPTLEGGLLGIAGEHVIERQAATAAQGQGVIFTDLRSAAHHHQTVVERYLGTVIDDGTDKFQALNSGWWLNGAFVYVPRGVHVALPLSIIHYQMPGQGLVPRSLIVLEEDSEVMIIDHYTDRMAGLLEPSLAAISVEVVVGNNAKLHYGSIEQLSLATNVFVQRAAILGHDATSSWNVGAFGAGLEVSRQTTYLKGQGSENHSVTVFFGSGTQHHDIEVTSVHQGMHSRSNMVGKGVMKGRSRSIFTGVTDIKLGASGSDARQKEQTLMLSDQARADAIPSLLIEENDVFAAHAASAGPVDSVALYYLQSRGLNEAEATRLIVEGFLAPVIDAISVEAIRAEVWTAVEGKVAE